MKKIKRIKKKREKTEKKKKKIEKQLFGLDNYTFRLIILSGLFLFLIKFLFSTNYFGIFANSLIELLVLVLIYMVFFFIERKAHKNWSFLITRILFFIVFTFNFIIFSVNSILLDRAIQMKFILSNLTISSINIVTTDIIRIEHLIAFILFFILICLIALNNPKTLRKTKPYFKTAFIILAILAILVLVFSGEVISNAYVNTISQDLLENSVGEVSFTEKTIQETEYKNETFDKRIQDYKKYPIPKGKKILLFITEEISSSELEKVMEEIPEEKNFFKKTEQNTHSFTNYYTTNQDSRTSIWTMLGSHYIPFESYIKNWINYYGYVLEEKNIVGLLHEKGYNTYVISALSKPIVLLRVHDWTNITILNSQDKNDYFCLDEFEFLFGCEDNAVLDDLKNILKNNKDEGLFVMQEMIYGHGIEYSKNVGKSRIEYYNEYFNEVYNFLEEEKMLDDTIIIITSDHGEKGEYVREIGNYRVPLVIINNQLEKKEINELYSHLDFKDILISYLNKKELIASTEEVFIIGQTGKNKISYIDKEGNYFLGKFSGENTIKLNKVEGLNKEEITLLVNQFVKYRQDMIEKCGNNSRSCGQCLYCNRNIMNALGEIVELKV